MKKHFTKLVLLIFTVAFIGQYSTAQTVIWGGPGDKNGEFDGGLNDWTVNAIEPNDSAVWVWEADAKADRGAYSGPGSILFSPSASNGAAVFDSDFYDNAGTPGNFGNGIAKAPQKSELISPEFSCAEDTSVFLRFYQSYRNYKSTTSVQVSNDGGENWSPPYVINTDVALNASTKTNAVQFIDISEYAAEQENVKIKFVFEANYYYWIIDDVTVLSGLNGDPRISENWYPANKYYVPQMQTSNVPLEFAMNVLNAGGAKDMTGIKADVSIVKVSSEETIFSDDQTFDLGKNDTTTLIFDSYTPSTPLDTGLYRATYEISYDDAASDFGKKIVHYFRVGANYNENWDSDSNLKDFDNYYSSYDGGVIRATGWQGSTGADNPAYYVNFFKTGDWVESSEVDITTTELNQRVGTSFRRKEGTFVSYQFNMAIFEMADTIKDDMSNFANEENAGIIIDNNGNVNLTYLGAADGEVDNEQEYDLHHFTVTDADGENDFVVMKPNKRYMISSFFDKSDTYFLIGYDNTEPIDDFFNSDDRFTYPGQRTMLLYYPNDIRWYSLGREYGDYLMGAKLHVKIHNVSTKDELLPNNTVQFANPVKENLTVNIKFKDQVDHATMVIHNINGDIIDMRNIYNVKTDVQRFNTGSMAAGTYIFTLFTKDKLISKKFVVVK